MDSNKILDKITREYQRILHDNLVGIYVHGSIAFGCFNPEKSDIDFIVVVQEAPTSDEKIALIRVLLQLIEKTSLKKYEMSVVLLESCQHFVYPTPYELHFSETHMDRCKNNIPLYCETMNGADKDLAAHFTVIKQVGISLSGKAIEEVFGDIPEEYFWDSILSDCEDAKNAIANHPVSYVLNLCRIYAYKLDRVLLSKEQGGLWGIENLEPIYRSIIASALESYKSNQAEDFHHEQAREFCSYMLELIHA
ncbi:streptomycin 3'-adenylyltransferase [Sporosarcina luteola]|nr:streptomycin 3'-adenylyltransferase [Sporosarcina luteola]